jgi:hypothetical protein
MTYTGKVQQGVVVFDGESKPSEGASVRVEEVQPVDSNTDSRPSVWDVLREFDGTAVGLPSDMAENHDHYIHGTPKRDSK